jgi:hypothetical protein
VTAIERSSDADRDVFSLNVTKGVDAGWYDWKREGVLSTADCCQRHMWCVCQAVLRWSRRSRTMLQRLVERSGSLLTEQQQEEVQQLWKHRAW